jgi:hypothetical protein
MRVAKGSSIAGLHLPQTDEVPAPGGGGLGTAWVSEFDLVALLNDLGVACADGADDDQEALASFCRSDLRSCSALATATRIRAASRPESVPRSITPSAGVHPARMGQQEPNGVPPDA